MYIIQEFAGMQNEYEARVKEHTDAAAALKEQLHESEWQLRDMGAKLDEKDRELSSVKIDNKAAWTKEDLLREQNKELATYRRERDNLEAERAQHLHKIHELQEHVQEKESQFLALKEQVEIKNMNSFSAMSRAIDYEISRQILLHNQGQSDQFVQETRLWEEGAQKTVTMQKKEGLADFRYFPEPDLPEVVLREEHVDKLHQSLPELPETKRRRYENMGPSMQDVLFLANDVNVATFFDSVVDDGRDVKLATNWIMGDIAAYLKNEFLSINEIKITPKELAELIASIQNGTISGKIGKEIADSAAIATLANKVIAANPKQLQQYHGGKTKLQGFFAGQVMKESKGKANPMLLNKILIEKLNEGSG